MSARLWRAFRTVLAAITRISTLTAATIVLFGLLGRVLRDRVPALALATYIPTLLLAGLVLGGDLLLRGRSLARPRYLLGALSLAAVVGLLTDQLGLGAAAPAALVHADTGASRRTLRVLQWNVCWAGALGGSAEATWPILIEDIRAHAPDVVFLNEGPRGDGFEQLRRALGPEWTMTTVANPDGEDYWYRLGIFARGHVASLGRRPVRDGVALLAEVTIDGRALRVAAVDGISRPTRDRTRMLGDLAAIATAEDRAGTPLDLLVGDFNAPAVSVGFDALAAAGFVDASASSGRWRGTWPVVLPLYDFDHVLVRGALGVRSWEAFSSVHTDHRGQLAIIEL